MLSWPSRWNASIDISDTTGKRHVIDLCCRYALCPGMRARLADEKNEKQKWFFDLCVACMQHIHVHKRRQAIVAVSV